MSGQSEAVSVEGYLNRNQYQEQDLNRINEELKTLMLLFHLNQSRLHL